jgi:uncharacterized protein YjbJ (UPF0337 family)
VSADFVPNAARAPSCERHDRSRHYADHEPGGVFSRTCIDHSVSFYTVLAAARRVTVTGHVSQERRCTERSMMAKDSGPKSGAKGIVEDIKGKAKEVIGEVTGDDSKEREGRAQQDKAQSQREVAEHEAKADAARSEASVHEAEQRMHEDK